MILWKSGEEKIQCGVDLCEIQQRRNLNALGFCSFHGTFVSISGAILSATNNSMAGGKLQLRDEKRFEQPQLASSQAIGVIGFPFEFPFEAIGKRFFIVANLQLRGLGGKIAVDRNSNADCRTKFQWRDSR